MHGQCKVVLMYWFYMLPGVKQREGENINRVCEGQIIKLKQYSSSNYCPRFPEKLRKDKCDVTLPW